MRPLTNYLPKALVPVLDVPLLDLVLDRGEPVPWAGRFVNVSHLSTPLREHLKRREDVSILDEGDQGLGTAATLRRLAPELGPTVVTCNCDLLTDISLEGLIQAHRRGSKPCTLAVRTVSEGADISIQEGRPRVLDRRGRSAAGHLFVGAACFEREALSMIPDVVPLGLTEGLLRRLIDDDQVALFEPQAYARDMGTLQDLLAGSIDTLDPTSGLVDPPGLVSGDGDRFYVGPGADFDHASLGHGAIVLADARVGRGTRLSRCIVWPRSTVPDDANLDNGIWFREGFIQL